MSIVKYNSKRKTKCISKSRKKMKIQRNPRTGYLRVRQTNYFQLPVNTLGVVTTAALSFKMHDLPQAQALYELFDSYRIKGVKVVGFPLTNVSSSVNPVYKMISAIDYDDDTAPTEVKLMNRSNVRVNLISSEGQSKQKHTWTLKPRYQAMIYESATGTGYGLGNPKVWLNTQDSKIPHFGLKIVWSTDPQLNSAVIWQFYISYDMEFKSLKSAD